MTIGELARSTACAIETIRYYEREGLLPKPARTAGNFRCYQHVHAELLSFIRHCRSLDMALDEIRVLLAFRSAPGENCAQVNALLDAHIGHVEERIAELRSLKRQLKTLRDQCSTGKSTEPCGVLQGLRGSPDRRTPPSGNHIPATHSPRR